MRREFSFVTILIIGAVAASATADLQNVQVGGALRIRGDWYTGAGGPDTLTADRWPAVPGRQAVTSPFFGWNDKANDNAWVEQRTTVHVKADFTDNVSAFIELDSYDVWGEDFRSNYLTGVDSRGTANVGLYQAYIDANQMFGQPLRLRIGRQELKFGSGWLVAPNDTAALFYGTSFDGVRLTYATDQFSVDVFWTKLAERSPLEEDGDVDFYGVYASYLGIKDITLDAYWLLLRDAGGLHDTRYTWPDERLERLLGVDHYTVTTLNTVGVRGAGKYGPIDFEAEAAYQFGNADSVGATFAGAGYYSPYGPNNANWNTWGANLEVGYNIDMAWTPRVFVGGAYFGGEDNRDLNFGQWVNALLNPFWKPQPSVSFNRLFSHWEYSEFIENTDLSNAWVARFGVSVNPTKQLKVALTGMHCASLAAYEAPWPRSWFHGQHIAWLPGLSFLSSDNPTSMGWEAEIIATYQYTPDLSFEAGWAHLFVGKGLKEGDFSNGNGLIFNGGTAGDDADYVYFETKLSF